MTAAPVLEIEGLTFGYNPKNPLYENFSLQLHRSEIIAVVGPSGSGKSTLFELITGALRPQRGTITAGKTAQVFQDPYSSFHPSYTIRNQIQEVASIQKLQAMAEAVQIELPLLDRLPHELSGGQLQRCSLIRALLMEPELLLADEPTSALDNLVQLDVMKLLLELGRELGILLITHDEALARWCSDRVVRIRSDDTIES